MSELDFIGALEALDSQADSFLNSYDNYWNGDGWEFFSSLDALRKSANTPAENGEAAVKLVSKLNKRFSDHPFLLFTLDINLRINQGENCPRLDYDQWGTDFYDWFTALESERKAFWLGVLKQANVSASKPSAAWYKKALKLVEGDKEFEFELDSVLSLITDANRSACIYYAWAESIQMIQEYSGQMIHPGNVNTIKGLVWFGALVKSERIAGTLGSVGVASVKKISGYGARSVKLANAS